MQNCSLNDIQRTKIRAITCFAKNINLKSENSLKDPNIFISQKRKVSLVSTLNKSILEGAKLLLNKTIESIELNQSPQKKIFSNTIFRKFEKNRRGARSDIPCGIETFSLLNTIHEKDNVFHIPLLPMIIFNCGLENQAQVISFPKLKFKEIQDISIIKKAICSIVKDQALDNKSGIPLFILKYRSTKRFEYSLRDLLENFPDTGTDCIIQKFIRPKGLKAIKYRVVLDKFQKVIIFSNKNRIDAKNDNFNQRERAKSVDKFVNLEKTVVMHKQISREIKSKNEWKSLSKINSMPNGNFAAYNFFHRKSYCEPLNDRKNLNINASTRFLTHADEEKTHLFEGKNQSFSEIIKITEYLKDKIDNYYLDDKRIVELAADFLQDCNGVWYLLKIKYGKVQMKNRDNRNGNSTGKLRKKKVLVKAM
ncbi:hypothetical protein SteCoe_21777 [Stentor coeruleus]|uniref:Uncharacterized protein n=1 Tax=Stentor coeruleus TaxID=5963 RepID=A0A1R2BNX0_9CILI|nr:hypothetical protein SteCoe_21777 [Stentor coeruleus]